MVQNPGCCLSPSLFICVWAGLFSLAGTVPTLPHEPNGETLLKSRSGQEVGGQESFLIPHPKT